MDKRYWTAEEEKYMNKYYLRQLNKRTAKALNRTVESVRKKAARMGINTYYDGYLSARVLGRCFSTNERAVKRWVEKFNLPGRWKPDSGCHLFKYLERHGIGVPGPL